MTQPGRPEGEAWIELHVDTSRVEPEFERALDQAAKDAEKRLEKAGEDLGEALSDGMEGHLRRSGRDLAEAVEDSTEGLVIQTRWGWRDAESGRFVRRLGDDLEDEITGALDRASDRIDPFFSRFGQGFADAIGAGFNVSGRSPLIGVLIPLVGVVIGLLLGAVQAASALVTVLATAPSVMAGVAASAGVLYLAFQGVGTAVEAAFSAKTPQELNAALEGLTPSAQKFVRSLLPLRGLFEDLRDLAQETFFAGLGTTVTDLIAALEPTLRRNVPLLASTLARFFTSLGDFFESPTFIRFVDRSLPALARLMDELGPDLITFLQGLVAISAEALPLLSMLGDVVGGTLAAIGYWLQTAAGDPDFQRWLEDMGITLVSLQNLFFALIGFVASFMRVLNDMGGDKVIDKFTEALQRLTFFIESPFGRKAIEGLVRVVFLSIAIFTGLTMIVLTVIASLNELYNAVVALGGAFRKWFADRIDDFRRWGTQAQNTFNSLPGRIVAALSGLPRMLFRSGAAALQGFIDGIRSRLGPLDDIAVRIASTVGDRLPGSPAKKGPLSGEGYSLRRGQALVDDFAKGIQMEIPELSNAVTSMAQTVVFEPNSIGVNFRGALPTQEQARATGTAVGEGIMSKLAARNTRLAVRTL